MVECFLAKEDVAGSTPVSRSMILLLDPSAVQLTQIRFASRRGTQVVRERSAKPLCVGSIPTRASILSLTYGELWPRARDAVGKSVGTHCNVVAPNSLSSFAALCCSIFSIAACWCECIGGRTASPSGFRECPSIEASVTRSTPDSAARVAQVCRQSYKRNGFTPHSLTARSCALLTFGIGLFGSVSHGKM